MSEVKLKASRAQEAAFALRKISSAEKTVIIQAMAAGLEKNREAILQANALDCEIGVAAKMSASLLDRLRLNEERIKGMADGLRVVAELADPVGTVLEEYTRPNGLHIQKIAVPMGVIGMIYEARPNVTADAAGLCIKAGSAVVLRGGSDAMNSNKAIVQALRSAIEPLITPEIIQLLDSPERTLVQELMTANGLIDLLIPRGGAGLIQRVLQEATVPVIETGVGNCHVYIDKAADLLKASAIAFNAKVQRPSVCNAAETLLVHAQVAQEFLPEILKKYQEAGVIVHGCERTKQYSEQVILATEIDYATEYSGLEIAVKVVDSLEEAIQHINRFGTKHTEAIITEDTASAEQFAHDLDAAAIMINASTRFTDGGEFGFGCEIGISTQKLHARGPMGLREVLTYKYIVRGSGQVRQ